MELGFGLIFEDQQLLVVNKPAGLGTQAPPSFDSLERRIRNYQRQQAALDAPPYLGIPHRLDRCVSGLLVFAKRKKAAQRLSKQFERRQVEKTYHALVEGIVLPSAGTWTDWLRKIPEMPQGEVVDEHHPDAKQAVLHYQVEATTGDRSKIRIQLETGRMHQIRIQSAARGFPVVGDRLYGSRSNFGPPCDHERERAIALHASAISFIHPQSREAVRFQAPFPHDWRS